MIDILCVGCHPDDVEMSMAGSILLFKEKGYRVGVLDLTNGEPTPFGTVEKRMAERDKATKSLGVDRRITLDLPNRLLGNTLEAREKVAEVYRELRPSILFSHYQDDMHPDHIAGAKIAEEARFHAKLTKTTMRGAPHFTNLLFYHHANHKRIVQNPCFIIDITPYFKKKLEICSLYDSQFHTPERKEYMEEMLTGRAMYYGGLIRTKYGEPFFSSEPLGLTNIQDFLGFAPGEKEGSSRKRAMADVERWMEENGE